ncbi:MAG: polyphosphate polymerase domain-containing protein [Patescibacteria group bacterium]|jgi:SPX domain protein involved in polyphosphate accumulation
MPKYRYERKFHIPTRSISDAVQTIKTHPLMFREIYFERTVNSLYFDTPTLHSYFESVDGVPHKAKVRVRWYNNDLNESNLEIKIKSGAVGKKLTYELNHFSLDGNVRKNFIYALKNSDVPQDLKIKLKELIPASISRFNRRYFISIDKKFRITLDYRLKFRRILSSKMPSASFIKVDHIVMEVKYESEDDVDFAKIAGYFPFRIGKFSKYNKGIGSI